MLLTSYTWIDKGCHVIVLFVIPIAGRQIPTELREDALDINRSMKFDDPERAGILSIVIKLVCF